MGRPRLTPEQIRERRGDKLVMLARTRVPLDQPLPPDLLQESNTKDIGGTNPGHEKWKDLIGVLNNARGCEYVACSRIAENPEMVLFVVVWWDPECLDEFRASTDYAVFLASLGLLDLSEHQAGGAASSPGTIQIIKFLRINAAYGVCLRGWLSIFTVSLAHPVTDAQRQKFLKLQGPRYPTSPLSTRFQRLNHGWALKQREVAGDGEESGIVVQDGVFYIMWASKEAEEEDKREEDKSGIPEPELNWGDDLREIGAVEAKEEHVNLVCIASGRSHKS